MSVSRMGYIVKNCKADQIAQRSASAARERSEAGRLDAVVRREHLTEHIEFPLP
jgi:hypothetical protein